MSVPAIVPASPSGDPLPDAERRQLDRVWADPPGVWGWLVTVDHKRIAARYVVTAFAFFALGGLDALVMRTQLLRPENGLVGPDRYNQLFTVHGTNMMFLFAVPIVLAPGCTWFRCSSARGTWRFRG